MTAATATAAREWGRGWHVVAASGLGLGVGAALFQYVSSLFIPSLEAAFGWSRGDISLAAAIGLLGALSAPFIGIVADRVGARLVAAVCLSAVALAHLGLASMTGELWQFIVGVGVISIFAPGCTALIFTRAVNGWFDRSKGLALGVMASSISIATLIVSPVLSHVIAEYGFRAGYQVLAALAGLLGVPVVLTFLRDAPSGGADDEGDVRNLEGATLSIALRSRSFWLIAAIMVMVNACASGALTQFAPLLGQKALAPPAVALLISSFAISVLVGRLAIGWLFDRVEAKYVSAIATAGSAIGCLLLLGEAPGLAQAGVAVVLIGLMQGAETDVLAYFIARLFGLRAYNRIYGVLFTISLIGTAAGVLSFGQIFDRTGNYDAALVGAAVLLAAACLLYFFLPSVRVEKSILTRERSELA